MHDLFQNFQNNHIIKGTFKFILDNLNFEIYNTIVKIIITIYWLLYIFFIVVW